MGIQPTAAPQGAGCSFRHKEHTELLLHQAQRNPLRASPHGSHGWWAFPVGFSAPVCSATEAVLNKILQKKMYSSEKSREKVVMGTAAERSSSSRMCKLSSQTGLGRRGLLQEQLKFKKKKKGSVWGRNPEKSTSFPIHLVPHSQRASPTPSPRPKPALAQPKEASKEVVKACDENRSGRAGKR